MCEGILRTGCRLYGEGGGGAIKAKGAKDAAERKRCLEESLAFRRNCVDDATEAIKANRHLARAYLSRGLAYIHLEMPKQALDDLTAAIREDPRMFKAYTNRGILFFKLNRFDACIKDFKECEALRPDDPRVRAGSDAVLPTDR